MSKPRFGPCSARERLRDIPSREHIQCNALSLAKCRFCDTSNIRNARNSSLRACTCWLKQDLSLYALQPLPRQIHLSTGFNSLCPGKSTPHGHCNRALASRSRAVRRSASCCACNADRAWSPSVLSSRWRACASASAAISADSTPTRPVSADNAVLVARWARRSSCSAASTERTWLSRSSDWHAPRAHCQWHGGIRDVGEGLCTR